MGTLVKPTNTSFGRTRYERILSGTTRWLFWENGFLKRFQLTITADPIFARADDSIERPADE